MRAVAIGSSAEHGSSISTRIYDRATGEVLYGRVPAGSVVVAGNLPSKDGKYSLYCAVIVKKVDEKTRAKTSLTSCCALQTDGRRQD